MTTELVPAAPVSPIDRFRMGMKRTGVAATIAAAYFRNVPVDQVPDPDWPDAQAVRWSDNARDEHAFDLEWRVT